jgi:hypothetical protein
MKRNVKALIKPARVLLLASLALMVFSCSGAGSVSPKEAGDDNAAIGTGPAEAPAPQSSAEKEGDESPAPDQTCESGDHEQKHGEDHQPCAKNFIVPPEEGAVIEKGVSEGAKAPGAEAPAASRLVFITTSRACACTMKRCLAAGRALGNAVESYSGIPPLEKMNLSTEPDKARELAKRYQANMLPVVLFLDDKDELLLKLEGEFSNEDINNSFARFFAKKE